LTPEVVSAILADFHAWLTALTAPTNEETSPTAAAPRGHTSTVDLHTLLGQLLAVRQEVNLQTRAVRAQQEQNAQALQHLTSALDALEQGQAQAEQMQQQAVDQAVRPLLKTLIDLYDALALASREMQRLGEALLAKGGQQSAEAETPSLLSRFFSWKRKHERERESRRQKEEERERLRQLLTSLVTGYTMSLQRIERALQQHGLQAIPAAGERFDPERMEVVEAVADSGRPSGEVVEEVRRGYLWNGRVFRYAQVRVAKG